jgi:hypothetical protein
MKKTTVLMAAALLCAIATISSAQMGGGHYCAGYYYPCVTSGCQNNSGDCQNGTDIVHFDSFKVTSRVMLGHCYPGSGSCDDTQSLKSCDSDFYTNGDLGQPCATPVCSGEVFTRGCPFQ